MIISIHPDGVVPKYEQIVVQVIYAVAAGSLEAGTLIPSVRELAEQLVVNPNTVARAYQELERQGVVTARRGRGMEVTAEAPESCQKRRRELAAQRLRRALDEAIGSGMPQDEVRGLVDHLLNNGQTSRAGREAKRT